MSPAAQNGGENDLAFWKGRVADLEDALREAESGIQDFMESSKALEAEMDKENAEATREITELQRRIEVLKGEAETWKGKFQNAISEHNRELSDLRKELKETQEVHKLYKAKLRDIELDNDELENAERMISESLFDMEGRYNRAVEKTALLEEELVVKDQLEEENQRLKDEIRELTEEVAVLRESGARSVAGSRSGHVASPEGELTLEDLEVSRSASRSRSKSTADHTAFSARPSAELASDATRRRGTLNSSASRVPRRSDFASSGATQPSKSLATSKGGAVDAAFTPRSSRVPRPSAIASAPPTRSDSHRKIFQDIFTRMYALESRIKVARAQPTSAERSAIPRPSSRLASSVGSAAGSPISIRSRASIDGNTSLSSIPVPVSLSAAHRPHSQVSSRAESAELVSDSPAPLRASVRPSSRTSVGFPSRVQSPLGTTSENRTKARLRRESEAAREKAGVNAFQSSSSRR